MLRNFQSYKTLAAKFNNIPIVFFLSITTSSYLEIQELYSLYQIIESSFIIFKH
jgi:hypothetical protein